MGTSKKQKKRDGLRYREFVLSPYGVIKIKSLGYISIKTPTRGEISHLVIDSTGLKVFGEGEWKVRQHGADRRRVWRKLHLAADSATHEIICADLSLSGTTDAQALPGLINQTHRKIREVSADRPLLPRCVAKKENQAPYPAAKRSQILAGQV